MGTDASIGWLNTLLDSNLAKLLLLPLGYALFRLGEYFVKRRAEKAGDSRDMASLHSAIDLQEKLSRNNMTLDDLKEFQHSALSKSTENAVVTAQHYVARAMYLADSSDARQAQAWPEANTQAELNEQSAAQFAIADDELTSLLIEKMASYGPEEAAAFQQSQDAWRAWRDAEAQWESKIWEGGSIRPLMVNTKLEQVTRERISAIQVAGDLERNPEHLPVVYKTTPRDLFAHIEPNTTAHWVREVIGVPHYVSGNTWHYRYKELQLQVTIADDLVEEVAAVFVGGEVCTLDLEFESFEFGHLTFGYLLELDPNLEIHHRFGARSAEIYAHMRIGTPSVYNEYFFGAIDHLHGGGKLLVTDFSWGENGLLSNPDDVLVNWVACVSTTQDVPVPSWFIK